MHAPERNKTSPPLPDKRLRGLREHIVAMVGAVILPAFVVAAIAVWAAVGSYRQAFDDRLEGTARALASAVESEIASHLLALATLATDRSLNPPLYSAGFDERASEVAELLTTRIVLVAPDLSVLLHSHYSRHSASSSSGLASTSPTVVRQVFDRGHPVVGNLVRGQATGQWIAPAYVPVVRDGQILYGLGLGFRPELLSKILAEQNFRSGGYAALVDGSGRIVARSVGAETYMGQAVRDWVTDFVQSGDAGVMHGANLSDVEIVTAYHPVAGTPGWFVTVAEPLATYHSSLWRPLATLAVGGLAAVGVALAVAVWIGGRVLRPVDWLTKKAERVAATGGATDVVPTGPKVYVREFEHLRAAVVRAHLVLQERAQAVAAGEARLRAVVDTAADAIVVTNEGGQVLSFNRAAETIFGYTAAEAIAADLESLIGISLSAVQCTNHTALSRTGDQQLVGCEIEARRNDGSVVPVELSVAEWQDANKHSFRTSIMRDISARKAAKQHQDILVREVDHRSKNILAVVQSVLRLTPKDEPGAFAAAETRVAGLARAHSLLSEGGWLGCDLRVVAERELASFIQASGHQSGPAVFLNGPPVPLSPSSVQPLAMVLHELATNAAKHGALSAPAGRVEVRWSAGRRIGEDGLLRLHWVEVGGPPVAAPPGRKGFGTRVIEATVRGQLGGSIERSWTRSGLCAVITVPLSRVLADAESPRSGVRSNAA